MHIGERWYVARVKPTLPWEVVVDNLGRQDFSSYMPVVIDKIFVPGKKILVERPLFPGYLFVSLNLETMRWRAVNASIGIVHLLPNNRERPLPLPVGFVEELQAAKPAAAPMIEITKRFLANEVVRIVAGPLAAVATGDAPRIGRIVYPGKKASQVAIASASRGEILATIRNEHLTPA